MALPRLIPIEELYAAPSFAAFAISPDGTRLGYLAPAYGHLNVWIRGIDEDHSAATLVTHSKNRGIPAFEFTSNPRYMLFRQDTDGNEDWHYYRVDLEDTEAEPVDLTPLAPGQRALAASDQGNGILRAVMNPRWLFFDHFDIDLLSGETTVVHETSHIMNNYSDVEGNKGFYNYQQPDGTLEIYAVDDRKNGVMRLVHSQDGPSFPASQFPIHYSLNQSEMYVGSYWGGSDDLRLVKIDHATGETTVVAERPGHSVDVMGLYGHDFGRPPSILTSARTGKLLAVRFVGDTPEMVPIDPEFAEIHAELMKLADGGELGWVSTDKDEQLWTVTFIHDRRKGLSYLYDRRSGTSTLLYDPATELSPADLAEVKGVRFEARDGLPLHGFLTLPTGLEPTNLPLIVKVHGGPWLNDMWRWDPSVQLLANRGYAVLQVNYRASTGYGQRHIKAGIREYGGAMNDDLIDGCEWAVAQGIADPRRLGIFGTSQGGYMTMVAITRTPDYFAAAVNDVGFSSIPQLLGDQMEWVKPTQINNFIAYCGDVNNPEDLADMESRSPINFLDRVVTPLLVIAGAQDVRVKQSELDAVVDGLRARGLDVGYMVAPDEGHGYTRPDNLKKMWTLVEEHFAQHLGGRTTASALVR